MPNCFHPNTDRTHDMGEPVQRGSATDTQIIAIRRGESTNPAFSHLSVCLTQSWHSPRRLNMNVIKLVVTFSLVKTYGMVSTSRLFPRGVVPRPAAPRHALLNQSTVVVPKAPPES